MQIRNSIENIYVTINSVRLVLKDLSFRTDLSEDWFNEMYSLLLSALCCPMETSCDWFHMSCASFEVASNRAMTSAARAWNCDS